MIGLRGVETFECLDLGRNGLRENARPVEQDFLTRNPGYPYIVINDLPKIENLKQLFAPVYRAQPVLVANSDI